jgi:hypothetical protein
MHSMLTFVFFVCESRYKVATSHCIERQGCTFVRTKCCSQLMCCYNKMPVKAGHTSFIKKKKLQASRHRCFNRSDDATLLYLSWHLLAASSFIIVELSRHQQPCIHRRNACTSFSAYSSTIFINHSMFICSWP